jgi:hypothetical protein
MRAFELFRALLRCAWWGFLYFTSALVRKLQIMPYVTEFNQKRILENHFGPIKEGISDRDIYNASLPFFNRVELSTLYYYKKFLEGDGEIESVYKRAEPIDKKKYVSEGSKPSYHLDEKCERLNSNFQNIELPKIVQEWDENRVKEFRSWFKKFVSIKDHDEVIAAKIAKKWNIETDIARVNFSNSGPVYKENLDINNVENRIQSLLRAQRNFYRQNRSYLSTYSKRTYLAFKTRPHIDDNSTGLSDKELIEKLKEYHNLFKVPIRYYIKEYLKLRYAKDITFEEKLLESLGFKKCYACYGEFKVESENDKIPASELTKLDLELIRRNAKKICYRPSDLVANRCTEDDSYLEFYYYCKVMGKKGIKVINDKSYRIYIIEYIYNDVINYEEALFRVDEDDETQIRVFDAYLVYTRFKPVRPHEVWRELLNFPIYSKTLNFPDDWSS